MNVNGDLLCYEKSGVAGNCGIISLNRSNKLHATNFSMLKNITRKIMQWESRRDIKAIIITSESSDCFCAGGDVIEICSANRQQVVNTFWHEYRLVNIIKTLNTPVISLIAGITMGCGLGLSVHAKYVVASNNLRMAMPETAIGFFPDVGASYFLNKIPLDGYGMYLALTGKDFDINCALASKLVDFIVPWKDFGTLIASIAATNFAGDTDKAIKKAIANFCIPPQNESILDHNIAILFRHSSLQQILISVEENDLYMDIFQELMKKSPASLAVTFELMKRGARLNSLADCLKMEFNLACNFSKFADFKEGVSAKLIRKDNKAKWHNCSQNEVLGFFENNGIELKFGSNDRLPA